MGVRDRPPDRGGRSRRGDRGSAVADALRAHRRRDHHRRSRPHPRRHQQEGGRRALRHAARVRRDGLGRSSRGSPALRRTPVASNRDQAEVPRGATVLRNRWGTAPGLWLEGPPGLTIMLPGRAERDAQAAGARGRRPGWRRAPAARSSARWSCARPRIPESTLAERMGDVEREIAPLTLAYLPGIRRRGPAAHRLAHARRPRRDRRLREAADLVARTGRGACLRRGRRGPRRGRPRARAATRAYSLGAAESCTGGTRRASPDRDPGQLGRLHRSRGLLRRSAQDRAPRTCSAALIEAHGAVSEEVARRHGARERLRRLAVDLAVAVTGIAGPGRGHAGQAGGNGVARAGLLGTGPRHRRMSFLGSQAGDPGAGRADGSSYLLRPAAPRRLTARRTVRDPITFETSSLRVRVQVTDKRRFGSDIRTERDPIHTPGGMAEPASGCEGRRRGPRLDRHVRGAELPRRGNPGRLRPGLGRPVEPDSEAIRRLESQLEEPRDRQLRLAAEFDNYRKRVPRERVGAERPGPGVAGHPTARRARRHGPAAAPRAARTSAESIARSASVLVDRKLRKELEAAGARAHRSRGSAVRSQRPRGGLHGSAAEAGAGPHRERDVPDGLSVQGQPGAPGAGAGVLRRRARPDGGDRRTSIRSSAFRESASQDDIKKAYRAWPSSTTPTPTRTTPRPPSASRRSPRRTACSRTPRSGSSTTRCGGWARSTAAAPRRSAPRGRRAGAPGDVGSEGFDFGDLGGLGDIFSSIFGRGRPRASRRGRDGRGRRRGAVPDGGAGREDHRSTMPVTDACPTCGGSGGAPGRDWSTCPECNGRGTDLVRPGRLRGQSALSAVPRARKDPVAAMSDLPWRRRGADRATGRRSPCRRRPRPASASGSGARASARPEAARPATSSSRSRCSPTGSSAATDSTSICEVPINLAQATLGTRIRVRTLDGKKVMLRIPPGTQPGRKFRIKGQGWRRTARRGDQLVDVQVDVPERAHAGAAGADEAARGVGRD